MRARPRQTAKLRHTPAVHYGELPAAPRGIGTKEALIGRIGERLASGKLTLDQETWVRCFLGEVIAWGFDDASELTKRWQKGPPPRETFAPLCRCPDCGSALGCRGL